MNLAEIARDGSSLIFVGPRNELRYDMVGAVGNAATVVLKANDAGVLSVAETALKADSFDAAESAAFDLVMPILSRISFEHESALGVSAFEIVEESTGVRRTAMLSLGALVPFRGSDTGVSREEHRLMLSAFREALASADPLYQVISFFRVVEGVRLARAARRKAARACDTATEEPPDRFPDENHVPEALGQSEFFDAIRPHLGRKFGAVLDQYRDILRNAIAHLNPERGVVIADRHSDVMACERALPVLRYIAREMLATELRHSQESA